MTKARDVRLDDVWPSPPETWSFSALRDARECPRRWALRQQSGVGRTIAAGGSGGVTGWGAIRGRACHAALEIMLNAYHEHHGPPVGSRELPDFWRRHLPQGVRALVHDALDAELARTARAGALRDELIRLRRYAEDQFSTLVQIVLSMIRLTLESFIGLHGDPEAAHRPPTVESEVSVRATLAEGSLGGMWKGWIDVVARVDDQVVLIDFKTGTPTEYDQEQLRVYACIFSRDPSTSHRTRVRRLALFYADGRSVQCAAPTPEELDGIAASLVEQASGAVERLTARPPVANPSPDRCRRCDVRGSCDAYWIARTSWEPMVESAQTAWDQEVVVVQVRGTGAELLVNTPNGPALILVSESHRAETARLSVGSRLRVVSAMRTVQADGVDGAPHRAVIEAGPRATLTVVSESHEAAVAPR